MSVVWHRIRAMCLQDWVHLATLIGVIVGAGSLVVSAIQTTAQSKQFDRQVALNRELVISDRWQEHIRMSIDHPLFASGDVDKAKISSEEYTKYIWFVEDLIFSSERILQYAPNDLQWVNAIIYEMRTQKAYILSDDFLGCPGENDDGILNCSTTRDGSDSSSYCTFTPHLRKVVRRSFAGNRNASTRLELAERRCLWDQPALTVGEQPNA